jgi:hypothetical protein
MTIKATLARVEAQAAKFLEWRTIAIKYHAMSNQELIDAYTELVERNPEGERQWRSGGTTPEWRSIIRRARREWIVFTQTEWYRHEYPNETWPAGETSVT